ncbi:MAG: YicC family protein [Clostridia bacterium]|nr:YicC family protein [Clostridia bacterium]
MQSMTGYGRRQLSADGREMTVELKTVNHRFLDLSFRMPRNLGFLEEIIRKELPKQLKRGHVDVFIAYRNTRADAREVRVDESLLKAYQEAMAKAAAQVTAENDVRLSHMVQFPEVLTVQEREEDQEAVSALAHEALNLALEDVKAMRTREGEALKADLTFHLKELERLAALIAQQAPEVAKAYRARLEARLAQLPIEPVEPQRLAQEVAIFADKCAIDEELSRLSSHVTQFYQMLEAKGETGRKLDFLVQELNREINTIGSKASDAAITQWVVDAKSEIEKLREQVQNVE